MRHQTVKTYLLILCLGFFVTSNTTTAQEKSENQYDIAAIVWPSYHPDDRAKIFWPDGIGEWQTVVSNKPKFEGHEQPRYPLWGYINEADPYVAEMEIEAATDHGVNVFIFDWYWYDRMPFLEGHLNDGFLKAKNKDKMKFYLMWANHDVKRIWDKRGADDAFTGKDKSIIWQAEVDRPEFEKICHRFIEKYFSQPNYYTIDDKPVFMIYSMNDLINGLGGVDETIDALNWFREVTKKAGYKGLELQYSLRLDGQRDIVVDDKTFGEEKQLVADLGFNSLTHYVYAHMTGIDRDYMEVLEDVEKIWNWVSDNYEAKYYPQVSVGWDASPRAHNFIGGITKNSNPENFESALRKAKNFVDRHPKQARLITVNSWNEWTETSYLMPCTMHGYGYLKAIKRVFLEEEKP
tara:strand:+ start:19617 stop:20834 length:1218 start_codon:yes stop_codon:yes gene_type:complete